MCSVAYATGLALINSAKVDFPKSEPSELPATAREYLNAIHSARSDLDKATKAAETAWVTIYTIAHKTLDILTNTHARLRVTAQDLIAHGRYLDRLCVRLLRLRREHVARVLTTGRNNSEDEFQRLHERFEVAFQLARAEWSFKEIVNQGDRLDARKARCNGMLKGKQEEIKEKHDEYKRLVEEREGLRKREEELLGLLGGLGVSKEEIGALSGELP